MPVHACVLSMQAKQGTELVGRTVYLRSTRPGRVEAAGEGSSAADTAAAATAAAEAPAATASSADSNTQPSALLLLGKCMSLVILYHQCHCMLTVSLPALVATAHARQQHHVPSHGTEQPVQQWARCKWYIVGLEQQLQSAQAAASQMFQGCCR